MPVDSDQYQFLAEFLPRFDLEVVDRQSAESLLDELREFYARPGAGPGDAGAAVITSVDPWRDWNAHVKAAVLCSHAVICDDPLLYVADHLANFAYFYGRTFGAATDERFVKHLRRQVDMLWDVKDAVRNGILSFRPLRRWPAGTTETLDRLTRDFLTGHLRVARYDLGSYPQWAEYSLPGFADSAKIELDRELWTERGLSVAEIVEETEYPDVRINIGTAYGGLVCADQVDGTFWTGANKHWWVARNLLDGLTAGPHPGPSRTARSLSFVDTIMRPALEHASTADILRLRADDEVFDRFQESLSITDGLRRSPGDDGFDDEVRDLFDKRVRPGIRSVQRAMDKSPLLTDLPRVSASIGLGYTAAVIDHSPVAAGLLGALAAGLGLTADLKNILAPESAVRTRPAFLYWKLGIPDG